MNKELEKLIKEILSNAQEHSRNGETGFAMELVEIAERIRAIFKGPKIKLFDGQS